MHNNKYQFGKNKLVVTEYCFTPQTHCQLNPTFANLKSDKVIRGK